MKQLRYLIDASNDYVCSQLESEIAVPVLQYHKMGPENNFAIIMELEKFPAYQVGGAPLKGTRKIPLEVKNQHRRFWGMKELVK